MNINGNWQATANCNYTQILDKKSRWDLQNNLRFGFAHSMGFANDGTEQAGRTLAFDNVALNDELTINYRINKIRIGAKAQHSGLRPKAANRASAISATPTIHTA